MLFPIYISPIVFQPVIVETLKIDDLQGFYIDKWKECGKCNPMIMKNGKLVPMPKHRWVKMLKQMQKRRSERNGN